MLDWETFLTTLYVMVDDFCQTLPPQGQPGPPPALSQSETLTLALLARWRAFPSERAFYRWAKQHLRAAFPTLPHRTQFNRQLRRQQAVLTAFALHWAGPLGAAQGAYEALDRTGVATRNVKRRGRGWRAGQTDIGFSNRLGWFHGFSLLLSVLPDGGITGWGFGPASAKDQALAETFLAARQVVGQGQAACAATPERPGEPRVCLESVGAPAARVYLADKGFAGIHTHRRWRQRYGAEVVAPPQDERVHHPWPKGLRRVVAGLRQIVETVIEKLEHTWGLQEERPHTLAGFAARLAARVAVHNCCLWLNRQLGRPLLAFADLVAW